MDQLLTPEFWKVQLAVVTSAPWLIAPLLSVAAAVVWWLRGTIAKGQIEGLRAQHEALKAHLVYAQEKERDLKANLAVATGIDGTGERYPFCEGLPQARDGPIIN